MSMRKEELVLMSRLLTMCGEDPQNVIEFTITGSTTTRLMINVTRHVEAPADPFAKDIDSLIKEAESND